MFDVMWNDEVPRVSADKTLPFVHVTSVDDKPAHIRRISLKAGF
jgi:hypothetical protein